MSDLQLYGWVVLGVLLSVFVPIAAQWLREFADPTRKGLGDMFAKIWNFALPYVKVAIASSIIAIFALAIYRAGLAGNKVVLDSWAKLIIYGYIWDSTFQKVFTPYERRPDEGRGHSPRGDQPQDTS